MLNMNSSVDGYPGNSVCICHTCKAAASTLYFPTDSAYFCNSCNECIHAFNSTTLLHECVWICTACENQLAAFTSKTDEALLCMSCDAGANLDNILTHNHALVPTPPFSSLFCKSLINYLEGLPDTILDIENQITASTIDEVDQDETDSWLLLEPDNCDDQTNGGFTYSEELYESFSIVKYNSCTDQYQHQDQNNQQQLYCAHQGEDGSDVILPVQSSEVEEQEEQRQQQQQQHNVYFNGDYKASKVAFMNTPSSSHVWHLTKRNNKQYLKFPHQISKRDNPKLPPIYFNEQRSEGPKIQREKESKEI